MVILMSFIVEILTELRKLKLIERASERVYVFFFFFGRVGDNLITWNS